MLLWRSFEINLRNTVNQVNDTIFSFALQWGFHSQICNPHPAVTAVESMLSSLRLTLVLACTSVAEFSKTVPFILFHQMSLCKQPLIFVKRGVRGQTYH